MISDWRKCKLCDVISFNPSEKLSKGTIAKKIPMDVLRPFSRDIPEYTIEAYSGGSKFRNGDTIMARITPCLENGKTALVNILDDNEVAFGSTEYIVMRAIPGVSDPNYIYYLATSPLVRNSAIKSMVGSSGRQRVQQNVLESLVLPIPPLCDQQVISSTLKTLDDKIEENTKINDNLAA